MKRLVPAFTFIFVLACAQFAMAAVYDVTLTPDYYNSTGEMGVIGDAAPGYDSGSWTNDQSAYKAEIAFSAADLGLTGHTLSDITDLSYWTKKSTSHVESAPDWYVSIYTSPFEGSPGSSWYGYRINAEPYFSANLTETPGEWTQWSNGGSEDANALRFFDSSAGYYGSYTDLLWEEFLASEGTGGNIFGEQEILGIVLATGSGWNASFDGLLDGFSISLLDGLEVTGAPIVDTYNVNFEATTPVPEPSTFLLLFAGLGGLAFLRHRRRA